MYMCVSLPFSLLSSPLTQASLCWTTSRRKTSLSSCCLRRFGSGSLSSWTFSLSSSPCVHAVFFS